MGYVYRDIYVSAPLSGVAGVTYDVTVQLLCPFFNGALVATTTNLGVPYIPNSPDSPNLNGCTRITSSGGRIYYKVIFATTDAGFSLLTSSLGINNGYFITAAQIVCGSQVVAEADSVKTLSMTVANTPGLVTASGICRDNVLAG